MPKRRRVRRAKVAKTHPVLLDRASLAVHEVTTSKPGRYIIDHVHVEQDGTTVGTNEKLVIAIQPSEIAPGDLPVGMLEPADVPKDGLNLPATMCKTIMSNLKGHAFSPTLECAVVTRCDKNLVEISSTTDLKRVKREGDVPAEGTFPMWKNIIERPCMNADADAAETFGPVVQIGFRLDMLEQLVKTLKNVAAKDDGGALVRFSFNANQGPVLIDGKISRDRRFIGMTGRIGLNNENHDLEDLNDWQNAILDFAADARSKENEDGE